MMTHEQVDGMFQEAGGTVFEGFPSLHSVSRVIDGKRVWDNPGVAMVIKPRVALQRLNVFYHGVADSDPPEAVVDFVEAEARYTFFVYGCDEETREQLFILGANCHTHHHQEMFLSGNVSTFRDVIKCDKISAPLRQKLWLSMAMVEHDLFADIAGSVF